jgi:ABC-type Fe3+-siderophore transport system permease subunit
VQRDAMKVSGNEGEMVRQSRSLFYRFSALLLAAFLIAGCSAQPMTLDQELVSAGVAGAIGAGSGAVFAYSASKSYPVSMLIGAAGMAGAILLYEEIKREAAQSNTPAEVPGDQNSTSPPTPTP